MSAEIKVKDGSVEKTIYLKNSTPCFLVTLLIKTFAHDYRSGNLINFLQDHLNKSIFENPFINCDYLYSIDFDKQTIKYEKVEISGVDVDDKEERIVEIFNGDLHEFIVKNFSINSIIFG